MGFSACWQLLVASLALVAAGCGGDDDDEGAATGGTGASAGGGAVEALPSSSCTGIEFEGEGEPDAHHRLRPADAGLLAHADGADDEGDPLRARASSDWKAGDLNIGYQVCDDATAQAAKWDSGKCSTNAQAYASNESVIGVIGTFNSGCAAIIIPMANQAPNGPLAMVSPANTYVCLTEGGPGCDDSEPDKYYPSGTRNYVRVVANDAFQGAAMAEFADAQGIKNVFILNDKEAYGLGVATNFRNAAESIGIKVAGFAAWDPKASSYEALMQQVKSSGADALFLGGLVDENGAQVIKDKVAVLGPNDGAVKLLAPDGFTQQSTIDESGVDNARGMFLSIAGVPTEELTGDGKTFIDAFSEELGDEPVDPYAAYGAQAAVVLLDAIERAGGADRAAIARSSSTRRSPAGSSATSRSARTAIRSRGAAASSASRSTGRRSSSRPRPRSRPSRRPSTRRWGTSRFDH